MGNGKKVCLIDDEKNFTELLGTLLQFNGFTVSRANDPLEGLRLLEAEPFDLIVADIMMPNMDGLTLMRRLRGMQAYARTPLFVLSAKNLSDEERKFIFTHGIHFVEKPFEIRRLVQLIGSALEGP